MKRPSLLFIILVLSFIQIATVFGQSFPVQIVPQAIPPTPVYFSSYANETAINGPLRVQITLNDLTIQNRGIRLRASFEGNGISFQSNEIVNGAAPLFLEGGLPLVLNNIDLAPYFRFENITGISPNVYGQPIPEGTYQFCFEVFDVLTGNRLSNRSCVNTVVFQNDPPILVNPQNRTIVDQVNPQNIVFQWTPRHINVSNVEYELSIVEIWDNQVDHQAAFLSSPPFFTTVTTATTYVYGPSDPLLLPDKNYAWRIQARAMQGAEEIGVFNNQGFSEIYVFGSTTRCELPSTVTDEVKGATNANILWTDFSQDPAEYSIRYRQKDSGGEWFYSKTTGEMITLWDLKPGTEYEYQLSKKCVLSESEYSTIQTFRTNLFDDDDSTYECGIAPNIDVSNQVPLESLEVDEKFTAGDFPVTVLEVNGGNGYFNGKGYVTIPYLKSIKVAVEFTNIFINQNKELAQGNVVTVYDPNLGGIIDPWDIVDDIGDAINGGDHTYIEPVDFDIDKVEIRDGEIVVIGTDENGNPVEETFPYDEGDTYTITGNNQVWGIDENGKAEIEGATAEGGAAVAGNTTGVRSGSDGTLDSPAVVEIEDSLVSFTYSFPMKSEESYGHDVADSPHEKNTYPKVKLSSGGDFYPIHKAVKNGASDTFIVEATFKNDSLSIDSLIFKTVQGLAIETEVKDRGKNQIKVTVSGHKGYRSQEAVITYKTADDKQVVVSSFFIHHLRPLERTNVTLVPVNGASISGIKAQVAQKFNEGGAQLNVIDGSTYTGNTSELRYTESGLLTRHPQSFIDFYQDFKANSGQYNDNSYYVFVFDEDVQPGTIAGFMPRNSQFGFVFPINLNTTKLESKRTVADLIAHEVGHGVFALSHPEGTGGQTNWLMDDKGPGNELAIRDWEAMGFDGLRINLFDDDEEGEAKPWEGVDYDVLLPKIPNTSDSDVLSFVSLSGTIYSLEGSTRDITFLNGFLVGFTINNDRYIAKVNDNDGSQDDQKYFLGYSLERDTPYRRESLSMDLNEGATVYFAFANNAGNCAAPQLFTAKYIGDDVDADNTGVTASNNESYIKKGLVVNSPGVNAIDISTTIGIDVPSDVFNCLKNGDLKGLYKRIEYTLNGKELGFLDEFFTRLNEFENVYVALSKEDTRIADIDHVLDVNSYGDVQYLRSLLKQYQGDLKNQTLKIRLKVGDEDVLPEFTKYIPYFDSLFACLNQSDSQLDSNNYHVPLCLWKDVEVGLIYTAADPALLAGVVDGGIDTVIDVYKLAEGLISFSDAYGPRLFWCEDPSVIIQEYSKFGSEFSQILANMAINGINTIDIPDGLLESIQRFKEIIRLADIIEKGGEFGDYFNEKLEPVYDLLLDLKQQGSVAYGNFIDGVNRIKGFFGITNLSITKIGCSDKEKEDAQKTREKTIEVLKFLNELTAPANSELREKLAEAIDIAIKEYLDTTLSPDNFGRYNQGKILFVIVSEIALAIATGGAASVGKGAGKLLVQTRGLLDQLSTLTQIGAKKLNNVRGIRIDGNKISASDGTELIEITNDGLIIKRVLPENATDYTILEGAELRNVDIVNIDGKQNIEIVDYEGQVYVRILDGTTGRWSRYGNVRKLPDEVLSKLDNWSDDLVVKLDDALGKYPRLSDELVANLRLLDHFSQMHTVWYYKLGLARAYKVSNSNVGSIDLPDNFVKVLEDLDLSDGSKMKNILADSQFGSKLGRILENEFEVILETAWTSRQGIVNSDLPSTLKSYYLSIYDAGYTVMSKQVKIKVPNEGSPEPDFLFFKRKNNSNEIDLEDVLYHDAKISTNTAFSSAQQEIKKLIQLAKDMNGKAIFQVESGTINNITLSNDAIITIKEMSKIGTTVDDGLIDLVRKLEIEN